MNRLVASIATLALASSAASAAPIFTDDFEDGSFANPPPSAANPSWQVLLLPGLNGGHENRWSVSDAAPVSGLRSALWQDAPCEGQTGLQGDCFPAGVLYTDPAPSRPGQVGTYFLRVSTRFEPVAEPDLYPLSSGGERFPYASAPGILLFPPDQSGLAGGYAGGILYNQGPDADPATPGYQDDPADDRIEVGILYIEGNVQQVTLRSAILLRKAANVPVASFFAPNVHEVQLAVRANRFIELVVDGQYYGRADTMGQFLEDPDDPGSAFTPLIRPQDTQDVALVGLAGNVTRYDDVAYDDAPAADANGNGVPDVFSGTTDADCDGIADAFDPDDDEDGSPDFADPVTGTLPNNDGDGLPDACDPDDDDDTCVDPLDGDAFVTDDDCSACGGSTSFDCDGDGVPNGCELGCGTNLCDPNDFCDTTPPSLMFLEPARDSLYVQDSMGASVPPGTGTTAAASITVKVRSLDSGSGVARVEFLVDGAPVDPAAVNPPDPPTYSFRYDVSGADGDHEIVAITTDAAGNSRSAARRLRVVDATAVTDGIATDVTDQYAVIVRPQNPAIQGSNAYAIRPAGGSYVIRYEVVDFGALAGKATRVPDCHDNVLFVVAAEGAVRGLTTPGAFPGFWHDPAHTVTSVGVDCDQSTPAASFLGGVYTVRIPAAALAGQMNQPVAFWAYVDVQDRAATASPAGFVDSASGFFNVAKTIAPNDPLADRLDETPTPVFLVP